MRDHHLGVVVAVAAFCVGLVVGVVAGDSGCTDNATPAAVAEVDT